MAKINAFETYEERITRYADTLIINSDHTGILDKDCLDIFGAFDTKPLIPAFSSIRQELSWWQPANQDENGTINLDLTKQYVQNNFDSVYKHLIDNDYIFPQDHTRMWILNDNGKAMKKFESHNRYSKYKDNEVRAKIIKQKGEIYWWRRDIWKWLIGVALGYSLKFLIELIKGQ